MNQPELPHPDAPPALPAHVPTADTDLGTRLQAWRTAGTALGDPVRLAIVDALARRASLQQGAARERLLTRLEAWMAAPAGLAGPRCADRGGAPAPGAAARGVPGAALAGLSALVDRLGRGTSGSALPGSLGEAEAASRPAPDRLPARSPDAVTAYQATWSRLRAEQHLRQALAEVPARAGPMNSARVVHRALQAMRALSPAYFDAFVLHADSLAWLSRSSGPGDATARPAVAGAPRRRPRTGPAGPR